MTDQAGQLDEEIESWKGFPWVLRKDDLELWNAMIRDVRDHFGETVETPGGMAIPTRGNPLLSGPARIMKPSAKGRI